MTRHISKYAISLALCLSILCVSSAQAITEYQLKSTFMVNFLKFIQWPGSKDVKSQSQIYICYTGGVPSQEISEFFSSIKVSTYKISLREAADAQSAIDECHILFFGSNPKINPADLHSAKSLLTVGEGDDFIGHGGMISFVIKDNTIKFIINRKPISSAGLRIDARLLETALKVLDQ